MILLTDEEILACQSGSKTCDDNSRRITNAQLKKVTEIKVIDCYGGNKLILAKDWQALLEEIK